ncbi:MAG: hypothetical protein KJ792_15645 [Actinobacteria bacterium]|nr:hypothetical protein [Actinomycetota bacterium]MCG2801055.1 hypothetical protein [Cellulomonas sp.]
MSSVIAPVTIATIAVLLTDDPELARLIGDLYHPTVSAIDWCRAWLVVRGGGLVRKGRIERPCYPQVGADADYLRLQHAQRCTCIAKGAAMAIPSTKYYSADERDPRTYHDYSDCPNGQQIRPENRRTGDGGLPRCGSCKRLD